LPATNKSVNARLAAGARLVLHQGRVNLQSKRAILPFFQNPGAETSAILLASGVQCPEDDDLCARLKAVNNALTTLEADDAQTSAPIGILVFYSVHPTALRHDAPLVSSDLAGRAMGQLEPDPFFANRRKGNVKTWPVAGFFNGAEGDLSPDWKNQRREDVLDLGDSLAQAVRALDSTPNLASGLTPDARHLEFPNNWNHDRPNGGRKGPPKYDRRIPGAALFGARKMAAPVFSTSRAGLAWRHPE
jgi:hypothetical protein